MDRSASHSNTNLLELPECVLGYDEVWVFLLDIGVPQGLDHGRLAGEEDGVRVGVLAVGQEIPRLKSSGVTGQLSTVHLPILPGKFSCVVVFVTI